MTQHNCILSIYTEMYRFKKVPHKYISVEICSICNQKKINIIEFVSNMLELKLKLTRKKNKDHWVNYYKVDPFKYKNLLFKNKITNDSLEKFKKKVNKNKKYTLYNPKITIRQGLNRKVIIDNGVAYFDRFSTIKDEIEQIVKENVSRETSEGN